MNKFIVITTFCVLMLSMSAEVIDIAPGV